MRSHVPVLLKRQREFAVARPAGVVSRASFGAPKCLLTAIGAAVRTMRSEYGQPSHSAARADDCGRNQKNRDDGYHNRDFTEPKSEHD